MISSHRIPEGFCLYQSLATTGSFNCLFEKLTPRVSFAIIKIDAGTSREEEVFTDFFFWKLGKESRTMSWKKNPQQSSYLFFVSLFASPLPRPLPGSLQ